MSSRRAISVVSDFQPARAGTPSRALLPLAPEPQSAATSIRFGSFCLWPVQRLLLQDNKPVHVGSRALELLVVLLERPGDLITKQELMARVWPNTFVEPANLTVHIAALRRVLGDGRDGNRFLINIPGRGYRFVAPVTVSDQFRTISAAGQRHNLPARVTRLIGRDDIVSRLSAQITRDRLLTVVGPGGIGKTAVALTVAEQVAANFRDGVWWIDLAAHDNPQLIAGAVASTLGLEGPEKSLANLVTSLRDKQMLLVLDDSEHMVGAVACLVAAVLRDAPGVHVLATSCEPLHTEGERLCRLPGLESPPSDCASAEQALRFPAVELFVERSVAAVGDFGFDDPEAAAVANICNTLNGIPFAIELAAKRVSSLGIDGLAAGLADPLGLLTNGHRTAPGRQQSMRATLDWSHALLTERQQIVLRRLSIFSGEFTLQDAAAVIIDQGGSRCPFEVTELVTKSLIISDVAELQPRFRVPYITRAYGLEKLRESGEYEGVEQRLAQHQSR